jgi:hypothetical protein
MGKSSHLVKGLGLEIVAGQGLLLRKLIGHWNPHCRRCWLCGGRRLCRLLQSRLELKLLLLLWELPLVFLQDLLLLLLQPLVLLSCERLASGCLVGYKRGRIA